MGKYVIYGGQKLSGSITVDSAKNALLPMIAASILTEEQVVIKACQPILDVLGMTEILNKLGVRTEFFCGDLIICAKNIDCAFLNEEYTRKLRTSVLMLGSLLARCGVARLTYPGGCEIGKRPIDIHLKALKSLGVNIVDDGREIFCTASKLKGADIMLEFPSVGATENVLLASVRAEGVTRIRNYAKEPEVLDLIKMLSCMGAKIGVSDEYIMVEGVSKLHGIEYKPLSDRIEAGTMLLSAVITGGELEIKGVKPQNFLPLISKFCDNTCKISISNDIIYIKSGVERKPFNVITGPYPMFPTDLQAQTCVLATLCNGVSTIKETIFENRFGYTKELIKMGARLEVNGNIATVKGVEALQGAKVFAKDLRGGAALVLAGLSATGTTEVHGAEHVERGYYRLEEKLRSIGANIEKQS